MDNEKQKNHFLELSECVLKRDEKTGEYTLGNKEFDRLYGINDVAVLSPDSDNVARLGAITYLMGIAGYETIGFVAVAAGYLATYKDTKTSDTKTLLISGHEKDNIDIINKIYSNKGKQPLNKRYKTVSELHELVVRKDSSISKEQLKTIIKMLFEKLKSSNKEKEDIRKLLLEVLNETKIKLSDISQDEIIQYIYLMKNQNKNRIVAIAWTYQEVTALPKNELKEIVNELMSKINQKQYADEKVLRNNIKQQLEIILENKSKKLSEEEKEQIAEYFYKVLKTVTAFTKVDDGNCDKNNLIICRAIFDDDDMAKLIYDIFSSIKDKSFGTLSKIPDDALKQIVSDYSIPESTDKDAVFENLKKFIKTYLSIIKTYFKYITIDSNNNNSQILNKKANKDYIFGANIKDPTKNIKETDRKYYMMVVALSNLCATDYTAVAAGKFLRSISGIECNESSLEQAQSSVIPQTQENNNQEKHDIRNAIASMTPFRTYRTR